LLQRIAHKHIILSYIPTIWIGNISQRQSQPSKLNRKVVNIATVKVLPQILLRG